MKDKEKTIHILIGLPASGKTFYANSMEDTEILNIDSTMLRRSYENTDQLLERRIRSFSQSRTYYRDYQSNLVIDGLFLTNESINKILLLIKSQGSTIDNIVLHYWVEDREVCLFNDEGRRNLSSRITIENSKLDRPNIVNINKIVEQTVTLEEHTIIRKDSFNLFKDTYEVNYLTKDKLMSSKWSNGGSYGNCWDDSMSSTSGDSPLEFIELDNLLEKIIPEITYLQYKKIRTLVKSDNETEYGYYNSSENYSWWEINLKELYSKLIEMELINE
jgi:hypothetical protein